MQGYKRPSVAVMGAATMIEENALAQIAIDYKGENNDMPQM